LKSIGSFVCFIGWASLFLGQWQIGIAVLVVGFALVILGRN